MQDDLPDMSARHHFTRLSQLQWAVTATTLLVMLGFIAASTIKVRYVELNLNVLFGTVFGAVALVYTYLRFDLKVATLCDAVAQLSVFVLVGGAASYVAAHYGAWSRFRDAELMAVDHAFGLDWLAWLRFMSGHPAAMDFLDTVYRSILWQAAILIVVLTATNRSARMQVFTLAFQIAVVLCVTVSALFPAVGAYRYLGLTTADHPGIPLTVMDLHVPTLMRLRGDAPVLPIGPIEGIVTFPSLHMTLAMLFIWGFWGVPRVRWLALGLNLLMIAATPLSGSHYFSDLAGGAAVAVLALIAARSLATRATRAGNGVREASGATGLSGPAPSPAV